MSFYQQAALFTGAAAMVALVAYKLSSSDAKRARTAADDAVATKIALIRENWSIGESLFAFESLQNIHPSRASSCHSLCSSYCTNCTASVLLYLAVFFVLFADSSHGFARCHGKFLCAPVRAGRVCQTALCQDKYGQASLGDGQHDHGRSRWPGRSSCLGAGSAGLCVCSADPDNVQQRPLYCIQFDSIVNIHICCEETFYITCRGQGLGSRHVKYGVQAEHYSSVGQALLVRRHY